MRPIYMDHAATTPVSEKALEAMLPYFREEFGNPSAVYSYGQTGKNILEKCRNRVAKAIGALPTEIYFTSCGTESDNWVLRSVGAMKKDKGRHIITTQIEHNAVKRTLEQMEKEGFEVTYLKPDKAGQITPEQLEGAIREDTILISIMLANNVVGTILPIKELSAAARRHRILFHTDAVQAVGHIPLNVRQLGVDFLSISGHKFNGPKGTGVLYCRLPNRLQSLLAGGGQEKEGRSGTENIPGIVGLTTALEENVENLPQNMARLKELADILDEGMSAIPEVYPTGDRKERLPGFCSYVIPGITHSVLLVNKLNERGICVSSGSACSASSREASHVLMALGYDEQTASCALRITMGVENTREEVEKTIQAVMTAVALLRGDTTAKAPRLEGRVSQMAGEDKCGKS